MLTKSSLDYYDKFRRTGHCSADHPEKAISSFDVGIVIVNWNSWGDTLESLEAIYKMEGFSGPVVVCDNASLDGSVEYIEAWAKGAVSVVPESRSEIISKLTFPISKVEIGCEIITQSELEGDGYNPLAGTRLWVVKNNGNLGFGAGSNVGIKLLEKHTNVKWFWLLNCDALPFSSAFRELQKFLPRHNRSVICGTALIEYDSPNTVQSCGASFNRLLCSVTDCYRGISVNDLSGLSDIIAVDYPVGASVLVNRRFIEDVGYMREDYFLYFEELDWVMRHRWPSKAFIVSSSLVLHKGGSTTGAGSGYKDRALSADYYFLRSRIIFARRYGAVGIITAVGASAIALIRRAMLRDAGAFFNALKAFSDGFKVPLKN